MGQYTDYAIRKDAAERKRRADERKSERAARCTGTHTTDPIKDMGMVKAWIRAAKEHDRENGDGVSWYLLLLLGFNTSLRIGDICKLRVRDVRGRERVNVIAQKTGKMANIKLQQAAQERLDALLKNRDGNEFVLQSRKRDKTGAARPITRQRAYQIIREIARRAEFEGHAGCHTMRKTFAYDLYETTGDLSVVQKVLGHSSQIATLRYIGLDQAALDDAIDGMHQLI